MAKKSSAPKKRSPQDATMRNVRSSNRKIAELTDRVAVLWDRSERTRLQAALHDAQEGSPAQAALLHELEQLGPAR